MAERIQVDLVDDIDGSPAKHTVTFALDGVSYEIDLNDGNAKALRSVLDRYIKAARAPKPAAAGGTKRQEREEEQARQANKQLTEQIRGAAQRTREALKKPGSDETAEAPAKEAEPELVPVEDAEPARTETTAEAPAVSLPLFSSAVD
ncbi:Lsr2 dimerization domain-containing protein [Saccharopolyspora mangrovi]|uniref:Histone-like nucleoid-structuring protein Lsr2 n=1 Tax=Saccharopolyspora mangrovi TaxID=3082379 RepID=A0ABU6A2Z7_9PSEU|nr:histone-like nucleoid-structuring protein Lsr2 [Saccharopolyspora sp. S2-29]MEB3365775.1 histone-like nucleoid-structuring protein Lsr2 [Saccharopolyspora sp. S2-29]